MEKKEIEKIKKAGEIAKQIKDYIKTIVKPGMLLKEIADKIESKIEELGGKPAFPVNLSINEIAAHDTPKHDDERVAEGLLKVDIGVHINGFVADTAISIDLENDPTNKSLIESAESALSEAIKTISQNIELNKIGKAIEKEISPQGFQPIVNLSGHQIQQYTLHAGLTIPNPHKPSTAKLP